MIGFRRAEKSASIQIFTLSLSLAWGSIAVSSAYGQMSLAMSEGGELNGRVAVFEVEQGVASSLLIPELELIESGSTRHTLIVMMNDYPRAQFAVSPVPLQYKEFVLMVPNVRFAGSNRAEPFTYWVKLYLDSPAGIRAGAQIHGHPMEAGDFEFAAKRASVSRGGQELAALTSESPGRAFSLEKTRNPYLRYAYSHVERMLNAPIVSKRADGTIVCSSAPLDFSTAQVRRTAMTVELYSGIAPGLMAQTLSLPKYFADKTALGGFEIQARRALSKPALCVTGLAPGRRAGDPLPESIRSRLTVPMKGKRK